MVDLPDALRPVNQIVKPRCLRSVLRSLRERDGCQVMLLEGYGEFMVLLVGYGGVGVRCHGEGCVVLVNVGRVSEQWILNQREEG